MTPEERELLMRLFEGYLLLLGNEQGPNRAHVTITFQTAQEAGIIELSRNAGTARFSLDDALSRIK